MNRWIGLFNLAQAAVYVVLAGQAGARWVPAGVVLLVAAGMQVIGGGWLLAGRGDRPARTASAVSLVVVALLAGLFLQVAVHIVQHFHPTGAAQGWQLMGALLLALPWAAFFPAWQVLAGRPSGREGAGTGVAMVLALLLPPAFATVQEGPVQEFSPVPGAEAAAWAFERLTGGDPGPPPESPGPVLLVAAVVRDGVVAESQSVDGATLSSALRALTLSAPARGNVGLVLEAATSAGPFWTPPLVGGGTVLVRPGETGLRGPERVLGAVEVWRPRLVVLRQASPGLFLPSIALKRFGDLGATEWVRTRGWLASRDGVVPLHQTWSAPPPLTADSVRAAALAGARHLAGNQSSTGKFAYVVLGPSGEFGRGYNYPRHAGTTWYLARVARRTGDPKLIAAALRGIAFMKRSTHNTADGRGFVLDPTRRDGRAWVGTTALALLTLLEMEVEPALQQSYAAFVASAVDDRGLIRGDLEVASERWPEQPTVAYAQGQGLLALAAAARGGLTVDDALDRAIAHVEGPYMPMPAARLVTLDEHWMCLAMIAVHDVRGTAAGEQLCTAYLEMVAANAPVPGSPLLPATGPAGALAEAVVARAELDRREGRPGPYHARAAAYGTLFLSHQYQPSDAPLLGYPERLVGGFRGRPWSLDVRIDSVQHIGGALLGVE
ncbi:MAG: hypothetical protein JRI25_21070, partial [Deltaproteobacteria bacterium]|nr:hypothetical protein [Deltaproteobacteria bacterium]